jgi:hypothetical protein
VIGRCLPSVFEQLHLAEFIQRQAAPVCWEPTGLSLLSLSPLYWYRAPDPTLPDSGPTCAGTTIAATVIHRGNGTLGADRSSQQSIDLFRRLSLEWPHTTIPFPRINFARFSSRHL